MQFTPGSGSSAGSGSSSGNGSSSIDGAVVVVAGLHRDPVTGERAGEVNA